jgi:hypothetical protein
LSENGAGKWENGDFGAGKLGEFPISERQKETELTDMASLFTDGLQIRLKVVTYDLRINLAVFKPLQTYCSEMNHNYQAAD